MNAQTTVPRPAIIASKSAGGGGISENLTFEISWMTPLFEQAQGTGFVRPLQCTSKHLGVSTVHGERDKIPRHIKAKRYKTNSKRYKTNANRYKTNGKRYKSNGKRRRRIRRSLEGSLSRSTRNLGTRGSATTVQFGPLPSNPKTLTV